MGHAKLQASLTHSHLIVLSPSFGNDSHIRKEGCSGGVHVMIDVVQQRAQVHVPLHLKPQHCYCLADENNLNSNNNCMMIMISTAIILIECLPAGAGYSAVSLLVRRTSAE